jgi:GH15 family glucan-1,4-alpha-glucosidase
MRLIRLLAASICLGATACLPAAATNLVTGNGFGFAVVSPETATVSKFYAHPYSFIRPDPLKPLSEGIETANFLKSLAWSGQGASAEYEAESQVIHARSSSDEGFVFMPFGLRKSALIFDWESSANASSGGWKVEWNHPLRSRRVATVDGHEVEVLEFDAIEERLLLVPLAPMRAKTSEQQPLAGSAAWAMVSLERGDDVEKTVHELYQWQGKLQLRSLVLREITELEQWRVKPLANLTDAKALRVWRQSEVMLRMAQSREPNKPGMNGNGLIIASLPDGVWFTPWVRDMAWATVALARMGHQQEARAAVLAYFNAQPTGKMRHETANADYQVSVVRYFGNGEEEPFFTMEGSTNIEFDDWGEALWVLGEYLKCYRDPALLSSATYRGRLYESARDYVAKPLLKNTEKYGDGLIVAADTSIWEERQKDQKHFAFSTAAAIVGLKDFAEVARLAGDTATQAEMLRQVALLQKGFDSAFIRDGKLHGTLEDGVKNDIDGALLAILHFGVVTDPAIVRSTVERMELLKVASGGYRRVLSTYTDPAIFEYWYERQEFLFVDFSLAEVDRSLGRFPDAEAIVQRIVDKAAVDHNIIPEMYVAVPCDLFPGAIGDPSGARPMVGYGAGTYILDVLDSGARKQGGAKNSQ